MIPRLRRERWGIRLFQRFEFFQQISDSGKFFGDFLQFAQSFEKFVVVKELLLIGIDAANKVLAILLAG
jgi:hypothetical protein